MRGILRKPFHHDDIFQEDNTRGKRYKMPVWRIDKGRREAAMAFSRQDCGAAKQICLCSDKVC
jgi:hypothetical protein